MVKGIFKRPPTSADTLDRYLWADRWQVDKISDQPGENINHVHDGHKVSFAGYYCRGDEKIHRLRCITCGGKRFSADMIVRTSHLFPLRSRHSDEEVSRVINGCYDGRMSLRRLYRNVGFEISPATVYRFERAAGLNCKSPLEVSIELKPEWGGFLQIDGTQIKVKGAAMCLLLAADTNTQDILHALILPDEKDTQGIRKALTALRDTGYTPRMNLIDDAPSLKKAVLGVYPSVPLQLCVEHKWWVIDKLLPDNKVVESQRNLKAKIHDFLFAKTQDDALQAYCLINDDPQWADPQSQAAIRSIRQDNRYLTTHFRVDERLGTENRSPRTNSVIEGINSRLKAKITQIRGFKSNENARGTINMLIMHYRATPFEGAEDKRSPLERANRPLSNWIKMSQRVHK